VTNPKPMQLRLLFHSIHNVMLAEELLLKVGIEIDMIPVPREISSDCGMCLACHSKDLDTIRTNFAKAHFTSSIMIYESKTADKTSAGNCKLILTIP